MTDPAVDTIELGSGGHPELDEPRSGETAEADGLPSRAAPSDVGPDQASICMEARRAEDRHRVEPRRAGRPSLGEGGIRAADYVVFDSAALPDPRTAETAVVADGLCRIIDVEGPMLARRAYDLYLRGCGIRRLGGELRTALNRALMKAVRDGRIISENEPGVTGLLYSTVRLKDTAPAKLRVRGPRTFEEIPAAELCVAAEHVFQADAMIWGSDEHLRAILDLFDLKRLTAQVQTRLIEILERP